VAETAELTVDAPVAPRGVLCGKSHDQRSELKIDRRPPRLRGRRLGPPAGDEPAVPSDHGCRSHDQEHLAESASVEHAGEGGEDRAIRVGESGPVDLALQDQDLLAQSEDLRVTLITGREQPPKAGAQQAGKGSEGNHGRRTVATRDLSPESPGSWRR
jgi:hypothetical protein